MKLTLLDLGGSAVTVSLATSAFSIALIPAVALSGSISDFVSRRQSILIVSSLGQLISVLLLGQSRNPQEIIILYTIYSFFCNLTPTVFSVLMLETVPKTRWGKGRDLILRNMIYGNILGLIINGSGPRHSAPTEKFTTIDLVVHIDLLYDAWLKSVRSVSVQYAGPGPRVTSELFPDSINN